MTALDFIIQDNAIIVAMDTLSLRATDNELHKMVTKFFPLPHMNCLICGTGNMGAIIDWFAWVENNIVANGIYQLNELTQQTIKVFMDEHNGINLCTIYQFGLHELDRKFHGYAYRSTNDFKSEEIEQGIGVKPPDAFLTQEGHLDLTSFTSETSSFEEILCNIMLQQKEYDDSLDKSKRLGIGGIVQIVIMCRDNIVIRNYKYFDDFDDAHNQILNNLNNCG